MNWLYRIISPVFIALIVIFAIPLNSVTAAIEFISGFEIGTTAMWNSISGTPAVEKYIVNTEYTGSSDTDRGLYSTTCEGFSFVAVGSGEFRLNHISFRSGTSTGNTLDDVVLYIYATDGSGLPTGAALGVDTITDGSWIQNNQLGATFADDVVLQGGDTYCVVFKSPTADASNYKAIKYDTTSPTYADSNRVYTTDGSTYYNDTSDDTSYFDYNIEPHTGDYLLECDTSGGASTAYLDTTISGMGASYSFYLFIEEAPSVDCHIFGDPVELWLTTDLYIDLYYTGKKDDGGIQLSLNTWYRVGHKTGAYTYIDGVEDCYYSLGYSTSSVDIGIMTSCTATLYFDDIVVDTGTATLGDYRIELAKPNANSSIHTDVGVSTDWQAYAGNTAQYYNVYKIPFETSIYNWAEADGAFMRYSTEVKDFDVISDETISSIGAVQWFWYYDTDGGGGSNEYFYIQVDSGDTTEVSIDDPKIPTLISVLELDAPYDGDTWTETIFNGLEIGMSTDDANKDLYWYDGAIQIAFIPTTGADPDISNAPSSKDFGVVAESTTYWSDGAEPSWPLVDADAFFTVTNSSGAAVDISISATNFTGGVGWTLTVGSPSSNTVRLTVFEEGDGSGDGLAVTTSPQAFIAGLADSGDKDWEIKFETGTFTDGAAKTTTVTLTAAFSMVLSLSAIGRRKWLQRMLWGRRN